MISCILLAAGRSERFGSPKALATLDGERVIERVLNTLLATRTSEIIVVLGSHAGQIAPFIPKDKRVKTVLNELYHRGQTSSFKKGLTLLHQKTKGILLVPVDMPAIKGPTIDSIIEAFSQGRCLILLPSCQGKSGHPPIFSTSLLKELKQLPDETPLCAVQRQHAQDIRRLEVKDEGVITSFNTKEELESLKRLIKS